MSDRTLRGARIGSSSLQSSVGVELSARTSVEYVTENGRRFTVLFAAEAEPPAEWVDPRSGDIGFLDDEAGKSAKAEYDEKEVNQRTHWDMLLERRSIEELEELLDERLKLLRARRGTSE